VERLTRGLSQIKGDASLLSFVFIPSIHFRPTVVQTIIPVHR